MSACQKRVDGRQELPHQIGPGELFGEIAVISLTPRSASVSALEPDTSVIAVDKARFPLSPLASIQASLSWRMGDSKLLAAQEG